MKELKTLKDIEYHENWSSKKGYDIIVNSNTLKQEAIKWVKAMKKIYEKGETLFKEHGKLTEDFELNLFAYEQDDIAGAVKFAMYFFNLTEKDLEGKNEC
jgi:tRNA G10  N-methylase Trm11